MQYDLSPILYAEVNVVCILFLCLMMIKERSDTYSECVFRLVLITNCILFIFDALWGLTDSSWWPRNIRWKVALFTVYYFASGPAGFLWYLFSESIQPSRLTKRKVFLSAIPLIGLLLLVLISLKTHWVFYVDEAGVYHAGPLYWLTLVLTYGYVLVAVIRSVVTARQTKDYTMKMKYHAVASYGLPVLIGGVLQELFFNLPIMCVGNTFALAYVFFSMQQQKIAIDGLTGINNHNRFLQYLSERMMRADDDKRLYLVMMDLDGFKRINDTYGHVEGDIALKKVAEALKKSCEEKHRFVARYGGDEFVAVCEMDDGEHIEEFCRKVHMEIKRQSDTCPYRLSISIGYALYSDEITTMQDFVKRADADLYREKREKKRTNVVA